MRVKGPAALRVLQEHEVLVNANAKLGGYDMDAVCPLAEWDVFEAMLDGSDDERTYLLGEFVHKTRNGTGRVMDAELALMTDTTRARIHSFSTPHRSSGFQTVDLRFAPHLALVIVTAEINAAGLVIIDGNHRAVSQYQQFGTLRDVPAFVCVHPRIIHWPFVPEAARQNRCG